MPAQTWPVAHSLLWRQLATAHAPARQSRPAAHCASAVQAPHCLPTQAWVAEQPETSWQEPGMHAPCSQRRPAPHSESLPQAPQPVARQALPVGQSLPERQWPQEPPARQTCAGSLQSAEARQAPQEP